MATATRIHHYHITKDGLVLSWAWTTCANENAARSIVRGLRYADKKGPNGRKITYKIAPCRIASCSLYVEWVASQEAAS